MENFKFIFAGNRAFVLEELLNRKLNLVKIFVIENSYLQKYCEANQLEFSLIKNKEHLVDELTKTDFDFFVANGLPIILPISKIIGTSRKRFINIHPSYLPDLRGADPVPGALLYGRDSGATCHYMDDQIDTGEIIAQVKIPYTSNMNCPLLYQLSFIAERDVIKQALDLNFAPQKKQQKTGDEIYYTLKESDKVFDFSKDIRSIIMKVRAFNTKSQGAYFYIEGQKVIVMDIAEINNNLLSDTYRHCSDREVLLCYENNILIKKEDSFLLLTLSEKTITHIKRGSILT